MDTNQDWQTGKTMVEGLAIILDNEIATDVTFSFPKIREKIKAHKLILMTRSHVFYVMFNNGLQDPEKDIEIPDIEPEVFRQFLRFLYTEADVISADNALHLMYAAQKYQLDTLKAKCVDFLQNNIDVSTVAMILDQAVLYDEKELTQTCLNFLKSLEELSQYHVSGNTLAAVISHEPLFVSEVQVVQVCSQWAKVECEKNGRAPSPENKRNALGSIIKQIRFCSVTPNQFTDEISPFGLLEPLEELAVLKYLSAADKSNPPFSSTTRTTEPLQLRSFGLGIHSQWGFTFHLSCTKTFKLMGIVPCTQGGIYTIGLNGQTHASYSEVCQDGTIYLSEPLLCSVGDAIDINSVIYIGNHQWPNDRMPLRHWRCTYKNETFHLKSNSKRVSIESLILTF